MKTILRYLLVLATIVNFTFATNEAKASTVYPIELTAQLLPPYSNCLGDYMSGSLDRVNVMAVLKDINPSKPEFIIQLRMVVRQGSNVFLEATTKPNNSVTFSMQRDGIMKRLLEAGRLLTPGVANVKASNYASNGYCLPEGAYDIEFQAFDNNNPTLPLSAPCTFHVYLSESQPPMPVFPTNNECVSVTNKVINFVWMERSVPLISNTKKYRLCVVEVPDGAVNYEAAFETGQKVFDGEIPGNITMKQIPVTGSNFREGRYYVWKVRSFDDATFSYDADKVLNPRYLNGGWSEIAVFRYDLCMTKIEVDHVEGECDDLHKPSIITIDSVQSTPGKLFWTIENEDLGKVDSFRVEYTLASDQVGFWTRHDVVSTVVGEVDENTFTDAELVEKFKGKSYFEYQIPNLDFNKKYVVRVCGIKTTTDKDGNIVADCHSKSDSLYFNLPNADINSSNDDCRSEVEPLICKEDVNPEQAPKAGDYIRANGWDVKIVSIKQEQKNGHTVYTGHGITTLPFLKNIVGIYMEFTDIRISCANELMEGKIETVYDEGKGFSLNLNGLTNTHNAGTGPAPQQAAIASASSVEAMPKGSAAVISEGSDKGSVYVKGTDGSNAKVGKVMDCSNFQETSIDLSNGTVKFAAKSNNNPPIDYNRGNFTGHDKAKYYEQLNGNYDVAWIAVEQGMSSTIVANYDGDIPADEIAFVCKTQQTAVELESKSLGGGSFEITVFGDTPMQSLNILAVRKPKATDGDSDENSSNDCPTTTLGKAKVASMTHIDQALKMIPVGDGITVNQKAIQDKLDEVYKPLGIYYTVEVESPLVTEAATSLVEAGFEIKKEKTYEKESENMIALQEAYLAAHNNEVDDQAAYLFVLPNASDYAGAQGIMPLTRSVGYVFLNSEKGEYKDGTTVAHELGHGLYSFDHAFEEGADKGTTNNLMDYNDPQGENLTVWQWNLLTEHKTYKFRQSTENSMKGLSGKTTCKADFITTQLEKISNALKECLFVDPNDFDPTKVGSVISKKLLSEYTGVSEEDNVGQIFLHILNTLMDASKGSLDCLLGFLEVEDEVKNILEIPAYIVATAAKCYDAYVEPKGSKVCDCVSSIAQPIWDKIVSSNKWLQIIDYAVKILNNFNGDPVQQKNAKANAQAYCDYITNNYETVTAAEKFIVRPILFSYGNLTALNPLPVFPSGLADFICKKLISDGFSENFDVTPERVNDNIIFNIICYVKVTERDRGIDYVKVSMKGSTLCEFINDQIPTKNQMSENIISDNTLYLVGYKKGTTLLGKIADALVYGGDGKHFTRKWNDPDYDTYMYCVRIPCSMTNGNTVTCTAKLKVDQHYDEVSRDMSCTTDIVDKPTEKPKTTTTETPTYTKKDECSGTSLFKKSASTPSKALNAANSYRISHGECPFGLPACSEWNNIDGLTYSITSTNSCGDKVQDLFKVTLNSKNDVSKGGSREFNTDVASQHLFEVFSYASECNAKDSIIVKENGVIKMIALEDYLCVFALQVYEKFTYDFIQAIINGSSSGITDVGMLEVYNSEINKLGSCWSDFNNKGKLLTSDKTKYFDVIFTDEVKSKFYSLFKNRIKGTKFFTDCTKPLVDVKKVLCIATQCLVKDMEHEVVVDNYKYNGSKHKDYIFKYLSDNYVLNVSNYFSYTVAKVQAQIKNISALDVVIFGDKLIYQLPQSDGYRFSLPDNMLQLK